MGNNPVSSVDQDGGETDPEKIYSGNNGQPLKEVNITAKRLSGNERASRRTINPYNFSNGKIDYEALYQRDSYASYRKTMAEQPQFDAYIADGAMILSGGEVFSLLEGSFYGLAKMAGVKLLSRGIVVEVTEGQAPKILNSGISNTLKFTGDEAVEHFGKHGSEIMKATERAAYNLKNYVDDANWIIQNGTYDSAKRGFYYIGNNIKGKALVGFVGLKNAGSAISTFHIKTAASLGL